MGSAVLERRLYEVRDASRLLRVPESTLRRWLLGDAKGDPVLRSEPNDDTTVSWGEFVEAGLLRRYRDRDVSLQHLRRAIEILRDRFDTPYPLATSRPYISANRKLVLDAQREAGLSADDGFVIEVVGGQTILRDDVTLYFERIEFDELSHQALRLHPAGKASPVVIDPMRSSGDTTVLGIRTEILREQVEAGEDIAQVAEDFDLTPGQLKAALAWEWQEAA